MRDLVENRLVIIILAIALSIGVSVTTECYAKLADKMQVKNTKAPIKTSAQKRSISPNRGYSIKNNGITHKRVKRWLNGKPAIVNILVINPKNGTVIKPSYGSYFIDNVKRVQDIVNIETAFAGINASYFKPDSGAPLGTSIVDGKVITGPLYRRVTLGITRDNKFKMSQIDIRGNIKIGDKINLPLFNINQPVFSSRAFTVYTDKWGRHTPRTTPHYSHIVVKNNQVQYVKNSSVLIPRGGYVLVGSHYRLPKSIQKYDKVSYTTRLTPNDWNQVEYAIGGGPYLIKNGRIFIDKQHFSRRFLWAKAPRTAIGYTRSGNLVMVTIDGRKKGFSEGATLTELAKIMHEQGAYNAMNLDGGTSTQMVVNGKLVNYPTIRGGGRVTNALIVISPVYAAQ